MYPTLRWPAAPAAPLPVPTIEMMIPAFTADYQRLWWACRSDLPEFEYRYTPDQQAEHEKRLDGLVTELKHVPPGEEARRAWQQRLRPVFGQFARDIFHLQPQQLEYIESTGLLAAGRSFGQMARQFDPQISAEDIYQAGRNVSVANLIQLLLGLPVRVTPSIFAYSMLYPYSDNYLDDPDVPGSAKAAFNQRFRRRLLGEPVEPANPAEAAIHALIQMIEGEWDRTQYPQVYDSLLAIHSAQARSLALVAPNLSPFEVDILGISFEKGGASVLADGYLAAGTLTTAQARVLFGFGALTQLMDDLEDTRSDRQANRASVFSVTAPGWKLDGLSHRFIQFGRQIVSDLNAFEAADLPRLAEVLTTCADIMLLNPVGRAAKFFSPAGLARLEAHMPLRFAALNKPRHQPSLGREQPSLGREHPGLGRLLDALLA